MSGYVASARIASVSPRLARGGRSAIGTVEAPRPASSPAIVIEASQSEVAPPAAIVERLRAARERWSQLTFFLFDPNSWRT